MLAHITLSAVAYRTPDGHSVLKDLDLAFGGERTGLIGRNGAGKTTLLRLIAGELAPTNGAIVRRGRMGLLRQESLASPRAPVAEVIGLAEPLDRLRRIEVGQARGDDLDLADWGLEARLDAALASLGLAGLDVWVPGQALSGGERTRAALAGLMAGEPDVLLLDEPTNHLDAEAAAWVRQALAAWGRTAIVASHDRATLRGMDRIVELTSLGARVYGGGFDLYAEQRGVEQAAAERELAAAAQAASRVKREAQAARERSDQRAAQGRRVGAQGGQPRIVLAAQKRRAQVTAGEVDRLAQRQAASAGERLAAARERVEAARSLAFQIEPSGLPAGRVVLAFEAVSYAWPGRAPLFADLSFRLTGPERVAITGPNGSGKSTALALALGRLQPTGGAVRRAASAAFLDQHATTLGPQETLLEAFARLHPQAPDNSAHAALARFLFRGEAQRRRVGTLSGGERLRAALACILGGPHPPQLLILDELTNHLDLASIGAVEAALLAYDGALLVVSHDADFLSAIGVAREVRLAAPFLSEPQRPKPGP
jgi:ATPase subunit of ABC transporter with duplicated ATPase domains